MASCSKLTLLARYINSGSFKEEFCFCSFLELTTMASEILNKVSLNQKIFCGIILVGALQMEHLLC